MRRELASIGKAPISFHVLLNPKTPQKGVLNSKLLKWFEKDKKNSKSKK